MACIRTPINKGVSNIPSKELGWPKRNGFNNVADDIFWISLNIWWQQRLRDGLPGLGRDRCRISNVESGEPIGDGFTFARVVITISRAQAEWIVIGGALAIAAAAAI